MTGRKNIPIWPNVRYLFGILGRKVPTLLWLMVFTLMIQGFLPLWQVFIPKILLGLLIQGTAPEQLLKTICLLGAVTLAFQGISTLVGRRYEAKISLARTGTFRVMLIQKLFRMKYVSFEDPEIQDLTAKAWNVTWSNNFGVEGALRHLMKMGAAFFTLLGFVGTLSVLHPLVPLLLILLVLLDQFLLRRRSRIQLKMREENTAINRRLDYINETMQDLSFGKEIRIMGMGDMLLSWHGKLMGKKQSLFTRERKECAGGELLQILLAVLREALVYGYLIYAVWDKGVSIADFSLYFASAMGFSKMLGMFLAHYEAFRLDAACLQDMRMMMELPEEEIGAAAPRLSDFVGKSITLTDVSYRYPSSMRDAVEHFTYTFVPGKRVALVGENGSGKTTLIKLICGLLEPDSGTIFFGETDGRSLSGWARYALFSTVFQDINLYAFTLGENTAMAETYEPEQVKAALSCVGLAEDKFPKGLDTMLRKDFDPQGVELSGGQRQALAIARAVYREGAVMTILDEPTAALDPLAEQEIYLKLDSLLQNRSGIFISHRLASTRFCDEILVMSEGALVEKGNHENLMAIGGFYARMYAAQSSFYQKEGC